MAYYSDHQTNLKHLNLQFRQTICIFIANGWSENRPWSPAEIRTIQEAITINKYVPKAVEGLGTI